MSSIKLVSSDNVSFIITRKVACLSVILKNMINDLAEEDDEEFEIPVPSVSGKVLEKVLEWAEKNQDTQFPDDLESDTRKSTPLEDDDREFLSPFDREMLSDIILAANYLNMVPLLDCGCKMLAENIRGKPQHEIREWFVSEETEEDIPMGDQ